MPSDNSELTFFQQIKRFFLRFGLKKEIYLFIENLYFLLQAGLDLRSSLESIISETASKRLKKMLTHVHNDVSSGKAFSQALQYYDLLPSYMMTFIYLGEQTGKLSENLSVLVEQNKKEIAFKSKTRSALLYAIIVMSLTMLVGIGTAWYTLPRIAEVYSSLDTELPLLTRLIIDFGDFIARFGYIVVPLFVLLLVAGVYFLFSFPRTKFIGHWLLMHIPLIKKLIKQVEISRFCYLMGNMISAGAPIKKVLGSAHDVTTFRNYRDFYHHLDIKIGQGYSFIESIKSYPGSSDLFPAGVRQMIYAGEKSGSLESSFLRLAKMYEAKVENTARNLPIILEPVLLIIIGIAVGIFVVGTIAPIYNLINIF